MLKVGPGVLMGKGDGTGRAGGGTGTASAAQFGVDDRLGAPAGHQSETQGLLVALVFAGATRDAVQRQAVVGDGGLPVPGGVGIQRAGFAGLEAVAAEGAGT